ncbi:hypothetical protein ASPZODRAFT_1834823 [Penicilliopsis zonata CBS 506.65]|uniref:Uncharacterized protein n=1 Tax=Penicilliopsis zonata CBS 506.65 TaxID=1073090 RepID=A0A1L9S4B5_9EURO|nr:hypothetical protein ASPZODRAFT_1834823 [Penicilliopsis zonata CBS 506.65]OJJ42011.1 hypothetical protein ASPZODRAFT_1834823 [Penicilliopsis zonata CBS 506.65]
METVVINEEWRQEVPRPSSPSALQRACFDVLSIVMQALPERYIEIAWEETESQFWELIESACVPLLSVVTVNDIIGHIYGFPELSKGQYLSCMLQLILRIRRHLGNSAPENLEKLTNDVLVAIRGAVEHREFKCLMVLVDLHKILDRGGQSSEIESLAKSYQDILDPRTNGYIGIALQFNCRAMPASQHCTWWSPLTPHSPSSIEIITLATIMPIQPPIAQGERDWDKVSGQIKAVLGFEFSRRKAFMEALKLLNSAATDLQASLEINSTELILTITELVNCCNILWDYELANKWVRWILQLESDLHDTSLEVKKTIEMSNSPSRYIHLLLGWVDLLVGTGSYDVAEMLLEALISKRMKTSAATQMILHLRLLKVYRQREKDHRHYPAMVLLKRMAQILPKVSNPLIEECLEEVLCWLLTLTQEDRAAALNFGKVLGILLNTPKIKSLVGVREDSSRVVFNLKEMERLSKKLDIIALVGPASHLGKRILEEFRQADVRLVERLATANWQRYLRIQTLQDSDLDTHPAPVRLPSSPRINSLKNPWLNPCAWSAEKVSLGV